MFSSNKLLKKNQLITIISILLFIILLFITYSFNDVNYQSIKTNFFKTKPAPSFNKQVKNKFEEIYAKGVWGSDGGGSGGGSTIDYTEETRNIIYKVVKEYKIKSMIDAPCGAMVWMPSLLNNITQSIDTSFKYYGVDIVERIINQSIIKYSDNKNWKFSVLDFTQQNLPDNYELIHTRDALQHLPLVKIVDALYRISLTKGARYLLVGSYFVKNQVNNDIEIGGGLQINLNLKPFFLTESLKIYKEREDAIQKYLVLYDIPNYLKKIDFDKMRQAAIEMSLKQNI